ncbi:UPF0481 protein [Gossypium australe]|uniref:UPF0481 protein n=1 Tax=Gossypium australe TaxID=47621 RepID=A0A5B6X081_9ROSI|nr:UPF0481 protein [Gossypium australe]
MQSQAEVTENRSCFYRVPHRLREVNEKAYEPNVVSIGPYHYYKPHLQAMQAIKRSFFWKIAVEKNLNVEALEMTMSNLEPRIRKCYKEELSHLQSKNLLEIMVFDGCFIVQLIQKNYPVEDLFKVGRIQTDIPNDLLLLENQLPFFVLFELYRMMVPNAGDVRHLASSALSFFKISPFSPPKTDIMHLLDLVHSCQHPSPLGIKQHELFKAKAAAAAEPNSQRSWKFIRSASELEGAGICFFGDHIDKMKDQSRGIVNMFDIMFTKDTKVLKIPTLQVNDRTESCFRNYMAYEQFLPRWKPNYFVDYVVFMDNLINTGKDVQILCENGVIDNWLGDDEAVALMFNKLRDSIYMMSENFYYAEIFDRVNEHCQRKWNKWMAALKKNYFNTPWSLLSFLAALALLLFTLLQTIFSVLSYLKQKTFTILKMHHRLGEVNEKTYEPNVISVGPYHHREPHLARMEDIKMRWFEKFVEKPHLGLNQFLKGNETLGKSRKWYEHPLPPVLEDKAKFVDMMKGDLDYFSKLGQHVSCDMRMINPNPGHRGHFYRLAASALDFLRGDPPYLPIKTTRTKHLLGLVYSTFHPSLLRK